MIYNPFKYYRLKRQAELDNWLTTWVTNCVKSNDISFKSKTQLLTGYYEQREKQG